MTRAAAIYVRISDDRSGEGLGVDRQEQDCRDLATRRGWDVTRIYRENDTSAFKRRTVKLPDGTTALRVVRPAFRDLLDDLTSGTITALVAYDLDRVARDPRDLEDLIDAVELRNAPAVSVTGSLDLGTDAGITMARVQVAIANKSSRDTSRRVRRAMLSLAESGGLHGGGRPYGYSADRVTPDVDEAEHVRWAYGQALQGVSLRSISIGLQERSPDVRRWDVEAVKRLLTSPRYAGLRQHQGHVVGPAQWPALVDRHLWDRVAALLNDKEHPARHVGGPRKYLLTGLLTCGRCHGRLYPRRNADRQRFGCLPSASGGCGGSLIVYQPAEDAVISIVLDRLREAVTLTPDEPVDPTAELHAELDLVEQRQRDLGEAFADEPDDVLAFRAASTALRRKADSIRKQITEAQQQLRVSDPMAAADAWPTCDPEQRRAVLDVLIERIAVGPGRNGLPRFDPTRLSIVWR